MSSASQSAPVADKPAQSQPAPAQMIAPNQFHLQGGGISVSYFPEGSGPLSPDGAIQVVYQDATRSLRFAAGDVRVVAVPDLGTIVSVTLVRTIDVGFTSFSLLVPTVSVPDRLGSSAPVSTEGITTIHRAFVRLLGHPATESYSVTHLSGTATNGILPA